jgi:predicted  nucleic acid-binding Zn-ribbon protein
MDETNGALVPDLKAELVYLQEELEVRDQLIQQLSEELFRLIQTSSYFSSDTDVIALPEAQSSVDVPPLEAEDTWSDYNDELAAKDAEIYQLRQIIEELKDRCLRMETVIQEFPNVYRRKFSERMETIRTKITDLQAENRSLRVELKLIQQRLSMQR